MKRELVEKFKIELYLINIRQRSYSKAKRLEQ